VSAFLQMITWRDVLDVVLVAIIIYNLLLLIRGTRAVQVLLGISFIAVTYFLARAFQLVTLQTIISNLSLFLPFAIIVLFQQEIRRALASFGRNPLLGRGASREVVESSIHEIVLATTALSNRQIGALIVIERLQGLRNYVENGIALDAALGYDLLINIFSPGTPLHDGAAIIQQDRIAGAACFLPLTSNPELSTEFGTRHRAALGISEETDALAVVVSEETAHISVAVDGEMIRNLDAKSLRNLLYQMLLSDSYVGNRRAS
jgi:diadenylate cyclase